MIQSRRRHPPPSDEGRGPGQVAEDISSPSAFCSSSSSSSASLCRAVSSSAPGTTSRRGAATRLASAGGGRAGSPTEADGGGEEEEEEGGGSGGRSGDSWSTGRQKSYSLRHHQEKDRHHETKTELADLFLKEEDETEDEEGAGSGADYQEPPVSCNSRHGKEKRKTHGEDKEVSGGWGRAGRGSIKGRDKPRRSSSSSSPISVFKSFVESFFFYLYMSFLPGFLTSSTGSIYPFSLWLAETRSAIALWLALATWACLISRGDAVTDPASFLVSVRTAKAWRREVLKKRSEKTLSSLKRHKVMPVVDSSSILLTKPEAEEEEREEDEEGGARKLASISVGAFVKISAASFLGASLAGFLLRVFCPSSSYLLSLAPLPVEVYHSLTSAAASSSAFPPPSSSSVLSSVFRLCPSSLQTSFLASLRTIVTVVCFLYAFVRHAFLGVCTAGISMILNPGGGHHEYQEFLTNTELFKSLFGQISFSNSLFLPSAPSSFFSERQPSSPSSSSSSLSSSPDYLTKLVRSFETETDAKQILQSLSSLVSEENQRREILFSRQEDYLLLLWSSRMVDMVLLEFLFAVLNYMSIALASILQLAGDTYHFKVNRLFLCTLNACSFFYFFGIPFCLPFGGPMLNAGYAALATAHRLDLIGFLLFVSADLFSACLSSSLVQPSFLASSCPSSPSCFSAPSPTSFPPRSSLEERKERTEGQKKEEDVCTAKKKKKKGRSFFWCLFAGNEEEGRRREEGEEEETPKNREIAVNSNEPKKKK